MGKLKILGVGVLLCVVILGVIVLLPSISDSFKDFMDRAAGFNLTLYIRDQDGNKISLPIRQSFSVDGIEATAVGCDYEWAITEPVDQLEITLKILTNYAGDLIAGTEKTTTITNPDLHGIGSEEWALDSRFDFYRTRPGREYIPLIQGTAKITLDGQIVDTKEDSVEFRLLWNDPELTFTVRR